jgi:Cys-tRNA(Pro)/Cys-tRNA(Cys) deacylase
MVRIALPLPEIAMSKETAATRALTRAGVSFTAHAYHYDPNADRIGLQAAQALGQPAAIVLKTLMALVDGKPVCVIVPSDREVQMKKLAAACGGKAAAMMKPADAERITGFRIGGISPFGRKRTVPTVIEQDALAHDHVFINGGQRGLQVRLAPRDAATCLNAAVAAVSA